MAETLVGIFSNGRRRKRKRQVSWAAAELLEEVKVFNLAKPVNPSLPPPAVDDGGEGDQGFADQPGLALLGLLGVGASAFPPSSNTHATSTTPPSNGTNTAQESSAWSTVETARDGPAGGRNGTVSPISGSLGLRLGLSAEAGGNVAAGEGSGRVGAGGSKLFKGFQTTETVVRRKKPRTLSTETATPAPETEALDTSAQAPAPSRYPKDVWPGHKPPSQKDEGSSNRVVPHVEGGDAKGAVVTGSELLEFFCDGCDDTIPDGIERMECVVCPDEFCLCQACYDEGELFEKKHEHELLPSSAPFHITSAAPNAEAAAAAAKSLHVTEAKKDEGDLDGGYDDDDLG